MNSQNLKKSKKQTLKLIGTNKESRLFWKNPKNNVSKQQAKACQKTELENVVKYISRTIILDDRSIRIDFDWVFIYVHSLLLFVDVWWVIIDSCYRFIVEKILKEVFPFWITKRERKKCFWINYGNVLKFLWKVNKKVSHVIIQLANVSRH